MNNSTKKILIVLGSILLIGTLALVGFIMFSYFKGGEENYITPEKDKLETSQQVIEDLTILQKAVESYFAKNLEYPEKLEALIPEFLKSIPKDPATGKPYIYETDIEESYSISVPDPSKYKLQVFKYENDVLIQE
jgi:hypothetical protein